MKVFVTGATGFLGSHVARVLADQGADLRLLVRSSSNLKNLEGLKAETVAGDLRDPRSLETAISGCDTLFHVAADYRLWVRDPNEMYRSNVGGTRALLEAARKFSVRRIVYTSSVATIGFRSDGQPADEDSPVSLTDMIGHYKRSKFMAEQIAMQAGRSGMDISVRGIEDTIKQLNAVQGNPQAQQAAIVLLLIQGLGKKQPDGTHTRYDYHVDTQPDGHILIN